MTFNGRRKNFRFSGETIKRTRSSNVNQAMLQASTIEIILRILTFSGEMMYFSSIESLIEIDVKFDVELMDFVFRKAGRVSIKRIVAEHIITSNENRFMSLARLLESGISQIFHTSCWYFLEGTIRFFFKTLGTANLFFLISSLIYWYSPKKCNSSAKSCSGKFSSGSINCPFDW